VTARWLWPAVALFGAFVYLASLGGLYIPHIGDEAPYIEIARLTAEGGSWLPLKTGPGLENTKPPLLYWVGIVATEWGSKWTLLRLRLPVAAFTFATALLTFWLCRKIGDDMETAWLAALTFLGFYSSFHYGRPFLINSPETFFVFSSFALVLVYRESWIAAGLALGIACLFKSFALIAPVGLALFWLRGRRRMFHVGLTAAIALAVFGLWPLLDPDPAGIFRHFVLEENLGKLQGQSYLRGLFSGPYALHWLWLGHFGNAGLFAVPLLLLLVTTLRERKRLSPEEKSLWILVLSFLLVYSVPSQRQENYLIPTVPALAILIARRWKSVSEGWLRCFAAPGVLFTAAVLSVVLGIRGVLPPGSYAAWQVAAPAVVLAAWVALLVLPRAARYAFHGMVFASFLLISMAVAPFEGPLGRYDAERIAFLRGKRVYVPSEFISRHERHRFLLPGARIEGYDPADADSMSRLLSSGQHVVVHRPPEGGIDGPFRVIGRRYDLRSRQTREEMWRILYRRELDLLVRQELVVRRHRRDRMD
jgi:4-amino-4-deoxy-L-arabinose transferase-like glycosyltransferase